MPVQWTTEASSQAQVGLDELPVMTSFPGCLQSWFESHWRWSLFFYLEGSSHIYITKEYCNVNILTGSWTQVSDQKLLLVVDAARQSHSSAICRADVYFCRSILLTKLKTRFVVWHVMSFVVVDSVKDVIDERTVEHCIYYLKRYVIFLI